MMNTHDPFAGMDQMMNQMMGGGMMNMNAQNMGGNMMNMNMQNMGGGSSVMSFSSFSSSSTGPDGQPVTVQQQYRTTSGVGPDGVRTTQTQGGTYDSRYGGQMHNKRAIIDRNRHERSHEEVYKKRLNGQEERLTNMKHLDDNSLAQFEGDWKSAGHHDRFKGLAPPPSMSRLGNRQQQPMGGLAYTPQHSNRPSRRGMPPSSHGSYNTGRSSRGTPTSNGPEIEVIDDGDSHRSTSRMSRRSGENDID